MAVKNIIFDLGGVVLNIDFKKTEKAFASLGFADFARYMTQYHITPFFEQYETGQINNEAFIRGIQQIAALPLTDRQITDAWNALLLDFPPERIALLQQIRKRFRIFLLSNTNALHYAAFQNSLFSLTGQKLEDIFEKTYYSHLVHERKPHAAIFQRVLQENDLDPDETLFIDDTASNLSGAKASGMQTLHLAAPMTLADIPLFRQD